MELALHVACLNKLREDVLKDRGDGKEIEQRVFKICKLLLRLNWTSLLNKYSKHRVVYTYAFYLMV